MATVGSLVIEMSANVARLQKDMAAARGHVSTATKGINSAINTTKNLLVTLGLGFSAVQVFRFSQGIIDAQDELSKLSQKLNISVESLAGWQHAGDLAGVSSEALQKGLKGLSTVMFDAASGLAESKRYFAALGIEVKKSDGTLKDIDAVMVEVADRFAAMKDGTEKTALAVKLFGRAGLDMIPMLNEGSAALAQMIAEGKRLNPVTAESARQAEIFNDNMLRLSKSIKTGFIASMNDALPRLAAISEEFAEAAAQGDILLAVLRGVAQGMGWIDPKNIALQKEMIELTEKSNQQFANIARYQSLGPAYAWMAEGAKKELAKIEARAKVLSVLMNPDNPKNYDARDLALKGPKVGFTPSLVDPTAGAAAKKASDAAKKAAAEYKKMIANSIKEWNEGERKEGEAYFEGHLERVKRTMDEEAAYKKMIAKSIKEWNEGERKDEEAYFEGHLLLVKNTTDEMTEFWRSAAQNMRSSMSDFFFDVMQGNLTDLGSSFKRTIDRMIADMAAAKAATALFGPDFGKGGAVGGLVGMGLSKLGGLFGFASGGSFTVGGSGGTDSSMVRFLATPGERVSVQTPAQQAAGAGAGITIQQTMHFGSDVDRATLMQWAQVVKQQTVAAVVDLRARNPRALGA